MALAVIGLLVALTADLIIWAIHFSECDRGSCGAGYEIVVLSFYALLVALVAVLAVGSTRRMKGRLREDDKP